MEPGAMLKNIKLIIYDLDGVLIDSTPAIKKSIIYALKVNSLDYDVEEIMQWMGTPIEMIFIRLFQERDQRLIQEAMKNYMEYYRMEGWKELKLQCDALETLRYFKDYGLKQSIASNSTKALMEPILRKFGIMDNINLFLGAEDVERPKPDPMILERSMQMLGVRKAETVFVDDSSTGLGAGKMAGLTTVGITTGIHSIERIMSVNPDFIISGLSELKTIIGV